MTVATEVRSFERVFIGGRWVEPSGDGTLDVISPITEEKLATIPETTTGDIDAAVAAARRAFDDGPWPRMSPSERAEALQRVAAEIEARLPAMEASFTEEIGAPSRSRRPSTATRPRCGPTPRPCTSASRSRSGAPGTAARP